MRVLDSIKALREDALARGMQELAIIYGWSAIRLNEEEIIRLYLLVQEERRRGCA